MGEYLSTPKKDKESVDGHNAFVSHFYSYILFMNHDY